MSSCASPLLISFIRFDVDGDEFTSYGGFLVQNFDKIGTEFYIGARNHELDRPGEDFDDVFTVLTGARVKF